VKRSFPTLFPRLAAVLAALAALGLSVTWPVAPLGAQEALSPEHQAIDFLIGEWRTTSEFPDGRMGEGELEYRWVLGGSWMRVEFTGEHPDALPWEAHVMQRWNPETDAYEAWVFGGDADPLRFRGVLLAEGHFRVQYSPEEGVVTGIDYHEMEDGTVLQENWMEDGGGRWLTLQTSYRPR
jgi:hypothetical protein